MIFFSKQAELERKFFGDCRKNFGRPAKTALRVPIRNIFKKNTVSEKESVSSHFCKSSGKVFKFCWSFIRWVVKIAFHVSNGTFWGFFFQSAFFLFQFRTLIEKFHAILENIPTELSKLIPDACPRVNIGERIFNRNIVFFILFGQGAKKFRPFDKFFKAEFWNYILRVHKNNLRTFLRKKT